MRQWKSTDMTDTGNTTGDRETAQNRMAARQRWNLMRYLAGGGIAAFTRSVEEEKGEVPLLSSGELSLDKEPE